MKRRQGFTLVELLVSMALIIFIMAILSQAFIAALGVFRNLKGQGDLAEKLRSTMQILQSDLAADHFDGGRRLSDSNFWSNGPPQQGFFRIWQGSTGTSEGTDQPNQLPSYYSTDHYLAFTVKLNGNDMGDFLSASSAGGGAVLSQIQTFGPPESRYQLTSGGAYNYQWGEVAWFLQPQINPATGVADMTAPDPQSIDPSTGTSPCQPRTLYTLYRRQRLLVPDNNLVTLGTTPVGGVSNAQAVNFLEMSCWPGAYGNLYFNSPTDITVPWRRFGMLPPNPLYLAYPAGLLFGANLPSGWLGVTNPWPTTWPTPPQPGLPAPLPPPSQPWNGWTPPAVAPPFTYPPTPAVPKPIFPLPSYPTLTQQGAPLLLQGGDIQLNDVVSFDVRALVKGLAPPPGSPPDPFVTMFTLASIYNNPADGAYNTAFNYTNTTDATAPAVFDTWSSLDDGSISLTGNYPQNWNKTGLYCIPNWNSTLNQLTTPPGPGPRILAIQVTIRIWDFKTSQTRQVTIVQAM